MARPAASHIRDALTSLLPPRRIRDLARELGVVQRRRKLDVVAERVNEFETVVHEV